jgi:hypothetical protein
MIRNLTRQPALYRVLSLFVISTLLIVPATRTGAHQEPGGSDGLSAQTVIFERLDQGTIDYETSLLYRAYALFDADRLPDDILGAADEIGEDQAFSGEVRHQWPQLSETTRRLLTPYVVRPNDSRSVFFSPGADALESDARSGADEPPTYADGDCQDSWAAKPSPNFQFKVWIHCTGDYEADMDAAIAMVEDFWEREVALM